jgi:hypothetical protein
MTLKCIIIIGGVEKKEGGACARTHNKICMEKLMMKKPKLLLHAGTSTTKCKRSPRKKKVQTECNKNKRV